MKKIILPFILLVAASQLKAQTLFQVKPTDSLLTNLFDKNLKLKPNNHGYFLLPGLKLNNDSSALNTRAFALNGESFVSHMPVVLLTGYDKMPIAKLNGYDRMPVLHLGGIIPGVTVQKTLPGIPTFVNP